MCASSLLTAKWQKYFPFLGVHYSDVNSPICINFVHIVQRAYKNTGLFQGGKRVLYTRKYGTHNGDHVSYTKQVDILYST
jgi:hypothetical protein